jgi:hypothetical protein
MGKGGRAHDRRLGMVEDREAGESHRQDDARPCLQAAHAGHRGQLRRAGGTGRIVGHGESGLSTARYSRKTCVLMLNIVAGKPVEAIRRLVADQQIICGALLLRELQMRRAALKGTATGAERNQVEQHRTPQPDACRTGAAQIAVFIPVVSAKRRYCVTV